MKAWVSRGAIPEAVLRGGASDGHRGSPKIILVPEQSWGSAIPNNIVDLARRRRSSPLSRRALARRPK